MVTEMLQHSFISARGASCQRTGHCHVHNNRQSSRRALEMRIIPCSTAQMSELAPRKVSGEQWGAYWGINKMERLQKVLESLLVAYGGAWMAWFLSMLAGNVVSSFTGTALIFNWMYSPWLNAKKRNAKVWRAGNQRLHYALYIGRIVSLKRVKRRAGKTIGAVSQEFLVMTVQDEQQRELEIVTQWQEPYSKLRLQMRCENMIASIKKDFSVLNMVTDSWIPACGVWVGDYPYLDRTAFRDFVATVEPAMPRSIKNSQNSDSSRRRKEDKSITPQSKSKNDRVGDDIDKNKYRWDKDERTDYDFDSLKLTSSDVEYYENFPMEGRDSRNGADASYKNEVDVNFDWDIDIDEKRESAAIDAANDNNDIQMRSKMRKASVTDDDFDVFSLNGKSDGNNNNDRNMKSIKNRFPTSTPLPKGRGRDIK